MDEQHIETEATLAKFRLRSQVDNAQDELATLIVMRTTCDALDKGDYGERALKNLFDLWRELDLGDEITGAAISQLRTVVDRMHDKSVSESRNRER